MVSSVDNVLHHLGKPGGYHLLVVILLCSNYFPITFHNITNVFYSTDVSHNCRLPEGWPWHKKFSIPMLHGRGRPVSTEYDECRMFIDPNNAKLGTKSCVYGWEFFPRGREWTINAEWGLVCEREYLVTLATSMYYGGAIFGGLVFGTLADKFGRRPLLLFALYSQTAASIGIYFVRSFILYTMLRFIHALLLQGLQVTTLCLLVELPLFRPVTLTNSPSMISRGRTLALMGCSMVSSVASICLSLITIGVQHWRYIQLAISLPFLVTVFYIWLIPESVRWLVIVAKSNSAISAAHKFTSFNRRSLNDDFFLRDVESAVKNVAASMTNVKSSGHASTETPGDSENYGIRELLFTGSLLRVCTLVLCFGWFSTSALHQALSQNLLEVTADIRLSVLIVGFVDLISFTLMYFIMTKFGHKKPLCALLVLSGAICISTVMAQNLERGANSLLEVRVVTTVLALIERSCTAACLAGLTVAAAEIFPTVVRAFGIGICLFCGQAGWIAAPYMLKLSVLTFRAIPWVIIGSLVLISGMLVQLLPEMSLKHLPDTLDDMEALDSRKKQPKKVINVGDKSSSFVPSNNDNQSTETAELKATTTPAEDYRAHIASIVAGQNAKDTAEKRWYQKNYSRRSAKVVRFYGLDTGGRNISCAGNQLQMDDPCHDMNNGKKEGIRMVRFSFENEEFRIDPHSPMKVRRFSVITEEPELEVMDNEEEQSQEKTSTLNEGDVCSGHKQSRFVVKQINESQLAYKELPKSDVQEISRFHVQPVVDDSLVVTVDSNQMSNKTSRFHVQRVPDQLAKNNNNDECVADKNVLGDVEIVATVNGS